MKTRFGSKTSLRLWLPLAAALGAAGAAPWGHEARAHGGHEHAPGEEDAGPLTGPIEVSEVAQRNLGLELEAVELRSVETTLRVIGELAAAPERSATVSSRIAGRVTEVFASEGEHVRKGQTLVEVESRQVGDPPPRVRYEAPVDGVVIDRHVVRGDQVEPSAHLLELTDLRELVAVGRVFEGQIGAVRVGQKVRVRAPAVPDASFEGVIERIAGSLDPRTRSLPVYVRVANRQEKLRPSMRATLDLVTGGAELAIAVPRSALLGDAGALYVFVQSEDSPTRFERRPLVLGVTNDRYAEVIEGLFTGERVVTQGGYSLQYLAPVPTATAPQTPTARAPELTPVEAPGPASAFSAIAEQQWQHWLRGMRLAAGERMWLWVALASGVLAAAFGVLLVRGRPGSGPSGVR